jgi:pimeloyl-ACP methyl ester carboxylesterase
VTEPYPYPNALAPRVGVEHSATVDGVDTHWWEYTAGGTARTIVMIHGYRGDHHGLQLFCDALPEYRVLIPDIPVFGASGTWPTGVRSIEDYGRWLREFLVHTDTRDAVVLGHSFGSIVVANALQGTRTEPIVLVNPISQKALNGPKKVLAALGSAWYRIGAILPVRAANAFLSWGLIVRLMSIVLAKTSNPTIRRWIHEQHDLYFSSYSDRDSLIGGYYVSTGSDVSGFASSIVAPVLLIAADKDDITPLYAQRRVQSLFPTAELHIIPGVGHLVHYEKPIETAEIIRTFLASN